MSNGTKLLPDHANWQQKTFLYKNLHWHQTCQLKILKEKKYLNNYLRCETPGKDLAEFSVQNNNANTSVGTWYLAKTINYGTFNDDKIENFDFNNAFLIGFRLLNDNFVSSNFDSTSYVDLLKIVPARIARSPRKKRRSKACYEFRNTSSTARDWMCRRYIGNDR